MTNDNDKLRRLREWVVAHQHNDDWGVPVSYVQQAESGEAYLEEKLESIERVLEQDMKGEHCRAAQGGAK